MAPLARRRAVAILISLLIAVAGMAPPPVLALPGLPWGDRSNAITRPGGAKPIPAAGPSGRLQEVAAPGGVQQLRNHLAGHQPRLSLTTPVDGSVIQGAEWSLKLDVEDWPLASDPDLGIGPHVALQIDDQPPLRFSEAVPGPGAGSSLTVTLPALSPGSHRLSAYAAYPWGEAVKSPGASLQWRLHQLQPLKGTQPERDDPWLVMVSPADLGGGDPLLLDWLVWNAPLQNLRDGDGRWRLRLTVNGDSFLVDRQDAIWIRQSGSTKEGSVQMELLDGLGEPITPSFNNQLRAIPTRPQQRPVWLQSRLTENELARLLGAADPNPEPQTETKNLPTASASPEDERRSSSDPDDASESKAASGELTQTIPEQTASPEETANPTERVISSETASHSETASPPTAQPSADPSATEREAPPQPADADAKATSTEGNQQARQERQQQEQAGTAPLTAQPQEERLAPTTSLGGSARELLNPDGTQR